MQLTVTVSGNATALEIQTAIVAGWTGRDRVRVSEHIAELKALGVHPPSRVPVFYRVSASRLTTSTQIESTAASSGEVEPVLVRQEDRLYVGVGSDHTDREVEAYGVAVAKQMCDKPIASELWPYDEVKRHWDQLIIRSWIDDDTLYQEGTLEELLSPDQLLRLCEPGFTDETVMFCGTLGAMGGIRPATAFRFELADPVLGRTINGQYEMLTLPLVT